MGHAIVRFGEHISELGSIVCPGCDPRSVSAQQRRVEDLVLEVSEARRENQRLSRNMQRLRDATGQSGTSSSRAAIERDSTNGEQVLHEELLQRKRVLWDLQRENARLKESTRLSSLASTPCRGSRTSSFAERRGHDEMEDASTAYNSSAMQQGWRGQSSGQYNERMSHTVDASMYSASARSASGSYVGPPERMSSAQRLPGSQSWQRAQQQAQQLQQQQQQQQQRGRPDASFEQRRMQALQEENEQLRRKVRMLASA